MKFLLLGFLLLAGVCPVSPLNAKIIYTFTDQPLFESQFPVRNTAGDASTVSLSSSGVQFHAQQDTGSLTTLYANAFSTASDELDFLSSSKTLIFSNVAFTSHPTGSSYSAALGVFAKAQGSIRGSIQTNPGDGIYIWFDRYERRVCLNQIADGKLTVLAYWNFTGSSLQFDFPSIELTLSADGWSLTANRYDGLVYTNDNASGGDYIGTFSTPITTENWGENFHLGMETTSLTVSSGRFSTLTVEQVTVIPEARTAMLLVIGALVFFSSRRILMRQR